VLAALHTRGIAVARNIQDVKTRTMMVTAHGASEWTLARSRELGLDVVEATCPLVHTAHRAVASLVRDGYHPVIVGRRDHVEVRGLTEDLDAFDVVLTEQDVDALDEHPRIGVAAQTTQPIEWVAHLAGLIRRRFPHADVRFVDTVCHPTKLRQAAAIDLARRCDVVIVVGGTNSNNTHELANTCRTYCPRVHHVQAVSDLRAEWFFTEDVVGITAGTSTPDEVIESIDACIRELAVHVTACQ
jgi:4-hydroxy-3-methylbut-2-enyl diphosphate reductase